MRRIKLWCRCGFAKHWNYLQFLRCCGFNTGWRDTDPIDWEEERNA